MNFIDLSAQQRRIRTQIENRVRAVLDHGQYIMGPEVAELETRLADYAGAKHGVSCSSGTDALVLALMAYGIGPGDAVVTTPFTFTATAESIALLGATPVFVDIDPVTFNMNMDHLAPLISTLKGCETGGGYPLPRRVSRETLRLRGIMPVDLFGLPADYRKVDAITGDHSLFVIEDAAQAFGAEYLGRKTCGLGHAACTSFFPAKPLGAYGDGGMAFTDNDHIAHRMRSLRIHGQGEDKYENLEIGLCARLDTIQAAVLLAKFEIFPEELQLRQQVANRYSELLGHESSPVCVPVVPAGCSSAWAQYSVMAREEKNRPGLLAKLKETGIPTAIYYPRPLHLQPAYSYLGYEEGDFPVSESCAKRVFSLPMHPYLRPEEQERIAGAILAAG